MTEAPSQVHGTCVAIAGVGVLLSGPSGSGKSDLALRLIDQGADLVADDRVDLRLHEGQVRAAAPAVLRGLLEVRGVGILRLPSIDQAAISAVVLLDPTASGERLPPERWIELAGARIPAFPMDPWQVSAPAKVRLVSQLVTGSISRIDD